jgi:hypothetical protein
MKRVLVMMICLMVLTTGCALGRAIQCAIDPWYSGDPKCQSGDDQR